MYTPDEYFDEAERLLTQAEEWMDADTGWRGSMSTEERIARRTADLLAANTNAALGHAALLLEFFAPHEIGVRPITDLRMPDNDEAAAGCTATAPDMTPEGDQTTCPS